MADMEAIADVVGDLSEVGQTRSERALALRDYASDIDKEAYQAEFSTLVKG
jgi:hypothetical protein